MLAQHNSHWCWNKGSSMPANKVPYELPDSMVTACWRVFKQQGIKLPQPQANISDLYWPPTPYLWTRTNYTNGHVFWSRGWMSHDACVEAWLSKGFIIWYNTLAHTWEMVTLQHADNNTLAQTAIGPPKVNAKD